jgi:hypothetical protein
MLKLSENLLSDVQANNPNTPLEIYSLSRFVFWKLALNSETLSIENRGLSLTIAFEPFAQEYVKNRCEKCDFESI